MKGENMRYLFIIVILVALILTAGCNSEKDKTVVTQTPDVCKNYCNDICYDPSKMTCCHGYLVEGKLKIFDTNYGCYNENGDLYCGGKIYLNSSNQYWGCCGGKPQNRNQLCCRIRNSSYGLFDQNSPDDGILFDGNTQTCYKNQVFNGGSDRNCGDNLLCPESMKCCNTTKEGPKCYDPHTYRCGYF